MESVDIVARERTLALARRLSWALLSGIKWQRAVPILLSLATVLPAVLVASTVAEHAVNIPYWDEWELLRVLYKLDSGELGLLDLWAQHSEHRPIFPRLVLLSLAYVSHWNVVYELWVNLAVAALVLLFLWQLVRLTVHRADPGLTLWVTLAASLLTFSMVQWENWAWGWQIQVFMNVLGAVVAVWALTRWPGQWRGFVLAYAASVLATFSFMTGLLLLVIIPLGIFINGGRHKAGFLLFGIIIATTIGWVYFTGYQKPGHHPDIFYFSWQPWSYLRYVLAYLGAPFAAGKTHLALLLGLLGLAILGSSGYWLLRSSPVYRPIVIPWILLAMYAGISAVATGLGRAGFGVEQAMASHYTTISILFWISLFAIGALTCRRYLAGCRLDRAAVGSVVLLSSLGTMLLVGYAVSYDLGRKAFQKRMSVLAAAKECFVHYDRAPDDCLQTLYPVPALLRAGAHAMKPLRFGPFRSETYPEPLSKYEFIPVPTDAFLGTIDVVQVEGGDPARPFRHDRMCVAGWALDPTGRRAARTVLIAVNGEVIGRAKVKGERPDVARFFQRAELTRSGWSYRFGAFRLPPGRNLIEAYSSEDGRGIVKLRGSRVIEVAE